MRRRARRPPRRHHPPPFRPLLPLLRRGLAGHLARRPAGARLSITLDPAVHRRHLLEGVRRDFPLHLLGTAELMRMVFCDCGGGRELYIAFTSRGNAAVTVFYGCDVVK